MGMYLDHPVSFGIWFDSAGATMARLNCRSFFAVLVAFICVLPETKAGAAPIEIPVITQNLYVGADADPVLANPTSATIQAAFNSVLANNFPVVPLPRLPLQFRELHTDDRAWLPCCPSVKIPLSVDRQLGKPPRSTAVGSLSK
jgi:hypothetical protein